MTPDRLPSVLAELLLAGADPDTEDGASTSHGTSTEDGEPAHPLRVLVDGAPAARPAMLADALVPPLQLAGRPVLRVHADGFLRPASVRFEHGRTDPDAYYADWLDVGALRREVLAPLGPGGSGRYLPSLWDPTTDRATREPYVTAPVDAVLLVDGTLLLGRGLPADLTIHLRLSPGALERHTDERERWTLPAYRRYAVQVRPEEVADLVVRLDDPRHPAVSRRSASP